MREVSSYRICKLDVCESPIGIEREARKSDVNDSSKLHQLKEISKS